MTIIPSDSHYQTKKVFTKQLKELTMKAILPGASISI